VGVFEQPCATFLTLLAAPASGWSIKKGTCQVTVHALVFLGAGLGGALRHGVNLAAARLLGTGFPYGTLTVNILGSLFMGFLAGYFAFKGEASQHWRLFLTTGVLGGFTTFSTFSLDAALLWERGDTSGMLAYVLASVALSVGGLFAGLHLVRQLV
jgi:CrcB protein